MKNSENIIHLAHYRPHHCWGGVEDVPHPGRPACHRIEVSSKRSTPLFFDENITKTICVASGQGYAVNGKHFKPISEGDFLQIAAGNLHQYRNSGNTPLVLIEVSHADNPQKATA